MKFISIVFLGAATLGFGCSDSDSDTPAAPGAFQADFATSGDFFSKQTALVDGSEPHGTKVQIWYSNSLASLVDSGEGKAPINSVAIKANHMPDGTFDKYTVMIKGDGSANDGWKFSVHDIDGTDITPPTVGCAGCHASAQATRDWLMGTSL